MEVLGTERPREARLKIRAAPDAKDSVDSFVSAFVAAHALGEDERARLLIMFEELLTNLIKYGYGPETPPGSAELGLALAGDRLTLEFSDDGKPFDPFLQPAPDLERAPEDRPVGGLGIHILRALSEEAHYSRTNGRNVVQLIRRVAPRP
jgi:anti-sigma regulatory factor (Ser/Thr protein kinase)